MPLFQRPKSPLEDKDLLEELMQPQKGRERLHAVFLDRDGVLNRDSDDFIKTPDELELLPGAAEAVARLNAAGYAAVVITNQSGIGRGLFGESDLKAIHARLSEEVAAAGGKIVGVYHCPHLPGEGCVCRKPAPGMLYKAAREHVIDLAGSYLVGDRPDDIACGAKAGCRTVLVLTGKTAAYDSSQFRVQPDHVAPDLPAAVDWILERK